MPVNETTISGETQLAFLADRVFNSLSKGTSFSGNDRIVFRQAIKLLDDALNGHQVLVTGQLQRRAVESLGAYGMTLNAYATLAQRTKATRKEDIRKVISDLRQEMDDLASGVAKSDPDIARIREFFRLMREISLSRNADRFDTVTIGLKFCYGSIADR